LEVSDKYRRATHFQGDKILRINRNLLKMEIFMDKFLRITSRLKYFQSAAKIFEEKYSQGWINIREILENMLPYSNVILLLGPVYKGKILEDFYSFILFHWVLEVVHKMAC